MRFMILVKANKDSEAGVLPNEQILTAMAKYNEELVKAGVMLAGDGLQAACGLRATSEPSSMDPSLEPRNSWRAIGFGSAAPRKKPLNGSSEHRSRTAMKLKFVRCLNCRISARATPSRSTGKFGMKLPANRAQPFANPHLLRLGETGDDGPALNRWGHSASIMEPGNNMVHDEFAFRGPDEGYCLLQCFIPVATAG